MLQCLQVFCVLSLHDMSASVDCIASALYCIVGCSSLRDHSDAFSSRFSKRQTNTTLRMGFPIRSYEILASPTPAVWRWLPRVTEHEDRGVTCCKLRLCTNLDASAYHDYSDETKQMPPTQFI